MAVRKFKPTTPGQRHKIIGTFEEITASVPEKSLVYGKRSTGGRNHVGKMTMRYIGGGHKRKFRIIDFKRNKDGVPAVVKTIEYDPNRSARIALLFYADGKKYLAHTLNNTVVAPPRMLIAFLENNLNADGTVNIPKALQPYMGGKTKIE